MKTIKINGFTMSLIVGFTILVYACKTDMMDYEGVDGVYFVMQRKPPSGYGDPEQYEYVDTTYIPFMPVLYNCLFLFKYILSW